MTHENLYFRLDNRFVRLAMVLATALFLSGCGGSEEVVELGDYLEELEFDRPLESVKEIKVNTYRIPCAAQHHDATGRDLPPLWVQMKFDLYVIAAEEDESAVLASIERHRGMLDDTIIKVCRQSTLEQLQDNRWSSIKTQLLDAVRPLLGEERIRQITLVYSAPWEPI